MACDIYAKTNGKPSILFETLKKIVTVKGLSEEAIEREALDHWNYLTNSSEHSPIRDLFGDYELAYTTNMDKDNDVVEYRNFIHRTDDNGELKLFFNKELNRYYFIDKYGERVLYPYGKNGLNKVFTINEIREFTKTAALEFYNTESNEKVTDFLDSYIDRISSRLAKSSSFKDNINAARLDSSKEFLDSWATEVDNFFASLKVKLDQKEVILKEDEENDIKGEAWRKNSFEKTYKTNVSNDVKLFLSTFRSDKKNSFGEYEFVPFDDIFSTLNKVLANNVAITTPTGIQDEFELYLNEIGKLGKIKPYFKEVYKTLKNVDPVFKNGFVSAFRLHKNNFLGSETAIVEDRKGNKKVEYVVRNLSEVGSRKSNLILQWLFNFNLLENSYRGLSKSFSSKPLLFNKQYGKTKTNSGLIKAKTELADDLRSLGVQTTTRGLDYFLNGLSTDTLSIPDQISKIYSTYNSIKHAIDFGLKNPEENMFATQAVFKELAEAEAFFMEESSDASIFTVGKTKWAYSYPSHLSMQIERWKKDPMLLYKHYDNVFNKNSVYIKYLLTIDENGEISDIDLAKERLQKLELYVFNSVQEKGDSLNASDSQNLTYKDGLVDYINKLLLPKSYKKTALAAGVSTEFQISYGLPLTKARPTFDSENNIVDLSNEVINIVFNYVTDEYNRIVRVAQEIEVGENLLPNYHTGLANGLQFQLLPSLNNHPDIFDINGFPVLEDLQQDSNLVASIKQTIKNELIDRINETHSDLLKENIFEVTYSKTINNNIDDNLLDSYSDYGDNVSKAVASDVTINSIISQVEYAKLFTGDMAFYKNYTDYQKRAKASYTDGLYLRVLPGQEKFNVSVIDSVVIPEPSLEKMKEYLPEEIWEAYRRVNSTDAQAWITPERWEFIIRGLGKWSDIHDSVLLKMNQRNPKFTPQELKLVAQPLKGVYFDVINGRPAYLKYSQAVLIPGLIKNTDLGKMYNAMTQDEDGSKLAYNDQIHELVTKDGIKVGYHEPIISHDANGNIVDKLILDKSIQLNNASWKLQQDLPTKGFKDTDIGSQIQKNIFQGLAFNTNDPKKTFSLAQGELTAEAMIKHINAITEALGEKGVQAIMSELGVSDDFIIENEEALYDGIVAQLKERQDIPKNIIGAFSNRTSPYAVPGGLQLFQNVFSSKINNQIVKLKTNGGGFIQMADYGMTRSEAKKNGVMAMPWWNEEYDRLHPPVLEEQEDGSTKLVPGGVFISGSLIAKYIPNYRDYDATELFGGKNPMISKEILQKIVGYRIPNQGLSSNDALQVLGILPAEMGDTVVAYAGITTKTGSDFDIDKMYLMIPSFEVYGGDVELNARQYIEEKDITQEEMVLSLLKIGFPTDLPNALVEKAFIQNALLNNNTEQDYHEDFYLNRKFSGAKLSYIKPDYSLPAHDQSKEQLKNMLINAYQSVLTSKHNIEDIMRPLDNDIMEKDISNLTPEENERDFMKFNALEGVKVQAKFRSAKQGLGQAVNYTMDFVRGSMADLYIPNYSLTFKKAKQHWGRSDTDAPGSNIQFDWEWSEELSLADLKGYVKSFNKRNPDNPITLEDAKNRSKIKLSETLIAISNAFVDVENKPYIINGNWVTQTNNLGLLLVRAGVHPYRINAFLNLPLIKEWVEYQASLESNSSFARKPLPKLQFKVKKQVDKLQGQTSEFMGVSYDSAALFTELVDVFDIYNLSDITKGVHQNDIEKSIRARVIKFLGLKGQKQVKANEAIITLMSDFVFKNSAEVVMKGNKGVNPTQLSLEDLRDNTTEDDQWVALDMYYDWTVMAKTLSKNVGASRIDVDGKGKDIGALITSMNKINDILANDGQPGNITGFKSKLYYDERRTPLTTAIDNGLIFSYHLMRNNPKYFLNASDSFINVANAISNHIYGEDITNDRLIDNIINQHYTYLMSGFSEFNLSRKEKVDLIVNMPKEFNEMRKKYPKNKLLQELYIKPGEGNKSYIAMPNLKKPVSYKNDLTDSFKDLLESSPEFAERLIKYSYVTSGFNRNISQFHEFIPFEWLNEKQINTYLKTIEFNELPIDYTFIEMFFRNNIDNPRYSKTYWFGKGIEKVEGFAERDIIKTASIENETPPYLIRHVKAGANYDTTVSRYQLIGLTADNEPVYSQVTPLGRTDKKGNRLLEYNKGLKGKIEDYRSVFGENNLRFKAGYFKPAITSEAKDKFSMSDMLNESSINYITENYKLDYRLELVRAEGVEPIFKKC